MRSVKATVAPPGRSLMLETDFARAIAAQRTPRRHLDSSDRKAQEAEEDRRRQFQTKVAGNARLREATGAPLTTAEATRLAEEEAALHLPEHMYNYPALLEFQKGTDTALVSADRALAALHDSGSRSSFVRAHYTTSANHAPSSGGSPRRDGLPTMRLRDGVPTSPPRGTAPGGSDSRRGDASPRHSSRKRSDGNQCGGGGGPTTATGLPLSTTGEPSPDAVDEWLRSGTSAEAIELQKRLHRVERNRDVATSCVADLFYNAQGYFRERSSTDALTEGVTSAVTQADYVFAVDPRLVRAVGSDFVRELMDQAKFAVLFLSDEELDEVLGPDGKAAWRDAAEAARSDEGGGSPTAPTSPATAATGPSPNSTVGGTVAPLVFSGEGGPLLFVMRYDTQSRLPELRRIEAAMRKSTHVCFDDEVTNIREDAINALTLERDAPE